MSWKNLSFNKGRLKMAKLSVRGKTLVLFLALSPKEFEGSKYFCMDFSESTQYEKVPLALKVKSERGLKYAKELVDILMERCECDYVEQKDVFSAQDYPFDTVANLIKRGLIKVYSDKEIDATAELVNIGFGTRGKVSLQEAHTLMADSVARDMIVKVKTKKENCDRGNKCVINIDTLSEQFSAGDTVDMSAMKDKGLIPCKASFVKVLARGVLDKPLTVVADDFSVDAVKMILLTGGSAIVS